MANRSTAAVAWPWQLKQRGPTSVKEATRLLVTVHPLVLAWWWYPPSYRSRGAADDYRKLVRTCGRDSDVLNRADFEFGSLRLPGLRPQLAPIWIDAK